MRTHVQTNRKKHAHVRKTWGTCGCAQKKTGWWTVPDEKKQPKHGKAYPQSRTFFSRNGKKSLKKSVPDFRKIPDFPDLFPWNGQFYVIQRTKIFQESPFFFCAQPHVPHVFLTCACFFLFVYTCARMCAYTRPREIHNVGLFPSVFESIKKRSPATVLFTAVYKNSSKFPQKSIA